LLFEGEMMMELNDYLYEIKKASKKGANEDIIHVSKNDDGYDLREAGNVGVRQAIDKNDNA
jgi:hypothetical protein